uniref:Amino acid adenylation n=1 Tax=Schistocephalus solidus TaxID=70667 RepID=A0A183THG9_SCHSO
LSELHGYKPGGAIATGENEDPFVAGQAGRQTEAGLTLFSRRSCSMHQRFSAAGEEAVQVSENNYDTQLRYATSVLTYAE